MIDDPPLTRRDRELVMLYWVERGILQRDDPHYTSYVEHGILPDGERSAGTLARWFARQRIEYEAQIQRYRDRFGELPEPQPLTLESPICSICLEPQFDTPSGRVCKNGHGEAPPL